MASKSNTAQILLLPGDGLGPEVCNEAMRVLDALREAGKFACVIETDLVGGASIEASGEPLTDTVLARAQASDAVILGAVGGPRWDSLPPTQRPEKGLLQLRSELGLYANLRPAILYPALAASSSLKADLVAGMDLLIIRELTGGAYFSAPRGIKQQSGQRYGYNTIGYSEEEIERILHTAFALAAKRDKRLCSVDKANVLEVSVLWREVAQRLSREYPQVELSHMYVDNAAMQLAKQPKQFDVIVTENMFGDILSDLAAMLTGSIGMLPSASLNASGFGMYEPVHGSAPDIAGRGVANPLATILCLAMMMHYTFARADLAAAINSSVCSALERGARCMDIARSGETALSTSEMGDAVLSELGSLI